MKKYLIIDEFTSINGENILYIGEKFNTKSRMTEGFDGVNTNYTLYANTYAINKNTGVVTPSFNKPIITFRNIDNSKDFINSLKTIELNIEGNNKQIQIKFNCFEGRQHVHQVFTFKGYDKKDYINKNKTLLKIIEEKFNNWNTGIKGYYEVV